MATADELLGTIADVTDDFLVVDLDTRIISIPTTIKILGVESDDDVKHLRFKVPRNYFEYDLSTFSIQVNFKNAKGEGDVYPVNDLTIIDDNAMTFTWIVDRHAFERYGEVDFSLCMKKFDGEGVVVKELNTAIASLPVLQGLETAKAVVENNPSAFDTVLFRLYAVEAATGNSQNGYYTIASVNQTDEGIELTIFGSDGTTVGTIRNGIDAYTPVKGVDYWTEEDKIEINSKIESQVESQVESTVESWAPKQVPVVLAANSWDAETLTQTVIVNGVTTDNMIIIAPATSKANEELYYDNKIHGVEQGDNYLKFECESVPESDVTVHVGIIRNAVNFE